MSSIKFLILVTMVLMSAVSYAEVRRLPQDLDYRQIIKVKQSEHKRSETVSLIEKVFAERNFVEIVLEGEPHPLFIIDWADAAFINPMLDGIVVLKTAVETNLNLTEYVPYQIDDAYIIHVPTDPGVVHSLYFSHFTLSEVQRFSDRLKSALTAHPTNHGVPRNFAMALMSSSKATADDLCAGKKSQSQLFAPKSLHVMRAGGLGCLKGILSGVWNASLGGLIDLGKGVIYATSRPVQAFKNSVSELRKLSAFIAKLPNELGPALSEFQKLPPELQARFVCETAATIGTAIFIPGALAKSLPIIITKMMKAVPAKSALQLKAFSKSVKSSTIAGVAHNASGAASRLNETGARYRSLATDIVAAELALRKTAGGGKRIYLSANGLSKEFKVPSDLKDHIKGMRTQLTEVEADYALAQKQYWPSLAHTAGKTMLQKARTLPVACALVTDIRDNLGAWENLDIANSSGAQARKIRSLDSSR
ncbi:MAG: hypothetical protein EOP06_01350 [Proteobacteria bacterium]|nr:MAG: hypothetical protein EOP06_01350 [Pseudomonadota bacterium]